MCLQVFSETGEKCDAKTKICRVENAYKKRDQLEVLLESESITPTLYHYLQALQLYNKCLADSFNELVNADCIKKTMEELEAVCNQQSGNPKILLGKLTSEEKTKLTEVQLTHMLGRSRLTYTKQN